MTKKKQIAKTLLNVLEHPIMMGIMDRQFDPDVLIDDTKGWWGFDLYTRKPGPALKDGIFVGTDLDLACFLSTIADRGAVINIPEYKSMRPRSIRQGERVVSRDNRHGPIMSLSANKDLFSFSIKIKDANVITTDEVGKPRNFTITDPSGDWYSGWNRLEWDPSKKENTFLTENELWTDNRVVFKNFVHPNRWTSFYGHHYFITKALIARLKEQSSNYYQQIKRMLDEGIRYPETGDGAKKKWPPTSREEGKSVKFRALEVEIDIPEYANEYPEFASTQDNLVVLSNTRNNWVYRIIPNLSFAVRCTELAFFKYGAGRMPGWLANVDWEEDFKLPGKRIKWDRLKIMQPCVGEFSVAIRKRVREKSEIMNMEYRGGIQ